MPSIADVYTSVFPETSKIAPMVRTAFREVDSDARDAGRRWGREIEAGLGETKVNLRADTSKVKAEIDATVRDREATIEVDADTAKAEAQIDVAARDRHSTINVAYNINNASQITQAAVQAGSQVGSAMGGSMRTELIVAGVAAIAAISSAASGLAALIPAALGGVGLGIGTLVVGLDGVKDAWDAVGKAAKESGSDQEAKAKSVASAHKTLRNAIQDEVSAQKDVARARKDALTALEDLNLELHGGALDVKQAELDARQAANDLATGTFETSLDYEQAQLRKMQADQRYAEALNRQNDLVSDANDMRAKGVDGADQVVAAEQRAANATENRADAQSNLNAVMSETSSSAQDAAEAMAALSPAGQQLITTLQGMMPQFQAFKFAIQDALLGGIGPQIQQLATTYLPLLQGVMSSMATTMNQAFGSLVQFLQQPETLASMQTIFDNIGSSFATWAQSLTPLTEAFVKLTEVGSTFLPQLAQGAVEAAQAFAQFINEAANSGELQQWIQTGIQTMGQLGDIMKTLGPIFLDLAPIGTAVLGGIQTILTSLAPAIGPLSTAFAALITAITPILGVIGQLVSTIVTAVAPSLTMWLNTLAPVIQQMAGLLQPVLDALAPVLQQVASQLAGAMVGGIRTILPVLVPFVQQVAKWYEAMLPLLPALTQLALAGMPVLQQAVALILPVMTKWLELLTNAANIVIPPLTTAVEFMAKAFEIGFGKVKDVVSGMWAVVKPILDALKWGLGLVAEPLKLIGDVFFGNASRTAQDKLDVLAGMRGGGGSFDPTTTAAPGITQIGPPFTGLPATGAPGALGSSGTAGRIPVYKPPGVPSWGQLPAGAVPAASGTAAPGAPIAGESARDFAHRVMMPYWQSQGLTVGDHGADKHGEHQNGALDIAVDSIAEGNAVLQQMLSDPNVYGAIFNNQTYGYGHGTTPRDYSAGHTGNPTQDHKDHVHGWYKPGGEGNIVPGTPGMSPLAAAYPAVSTPAPIPGMPTGTPTDPTYIALSPNIPAGQRKADKDSGGEQLGQDIFSGIGEIFGFGDIFPDPTQFGLFKIFKGLMGLKPKDGGAPGSSGSLFPGGGGGGISGILSSIPQAFGDLNVGSPKDAPGQFMPLVPGSGASAVLPSPFAPPNDPSRVAGPGNPVVNNFDMSGSQYGASTTGVVDHIQQSQLPAIRTAQNGLP